MSAPAIQVERLGKRYFLAHRRGLQFPTLRETLVNAAWAVGRTLLHPLARRTSERAGRETFWALKDVSFSVEQGERVGIIGRNGAGKSTLLKILSRITEPTAGRVAIRGRVASLLDVGTGFHPDLSGRENIFLNGAVLGMPRSEIRGKFDEIVAFAELERFLDTPVKRYSSGMYVRLAFSIAAHLEPEILIIDEVLEVGDAQFKKKCLGKMREVSRGERRTVLFVSHNMAAVQALCSRAILLTQGQVAQIGAPEQVIDSYIRRGGSTALANATLVGEDFALCKITAGTSDGAPLATLKPAEVQITFRPLRDVCDAGAHIIFDDLNGSPILGLDSSDFVQNVRARADQEVTCTFHIESLPLNPGPFRLRLWLRSRADHFHWEVPTTYDLNVEETLVYGARRIERSAHGATCANARVTIQASLAELGSTRHSAQ